MLGSRRFLLSLALSGLFIGFFLYRVDLEEMGRVLREANYLFVLPSLFLYLIALGWRTLRWRSILLPMGRFRLRRLWPVVIVGYAANNLLPVRLGELVRAYYLGQREVVSKTAALATILVERVFDGLTLLFLVAVVALFLPVARLFQDLGEQVNVHPLVLALGLIVPFLLLSGALVSLARWPDRTTQLLTRLAGRLPGDTGSSLASLVARFLVGLSALRDPKRLLVISLFSLPVWLSEAALFFTIALSFDLQDTLGGWTTMVGVLVVTTAISNLGTSVPSTGGGVGPFEFFVQATLIAFGVGSAVASAYTLVVHATLLLPVTAMGLLYLWGGNLSLGRLARDSQTKGETAGTTPPQPTEGGGPP